MRRVVLSEGMNDTEFLSRCVSHSGVSPECRRLDLNIDKSNIHDSRESEAIRKLKSSYNRTELLMKSEGNKDKLFEAFTTLCPQMAADRYEIYLLIDLDNKPPSHVHEKINEKLSGQHPGNQISIKASSDIQEYSVLKKQDYHIVTGANPIKELAILSFEESLEDVAGISEGEPRDVKDQKIDELASDPTVWRGVISCLSL